MLHRLRVRDRGDNVSFRHERALPGIVLRFPALAAELVRLKGDAIVALYVPSALAAKQATQDIRMSRWRPASRSITPYMEDVRAALRSAIVSGYVPGERKQRASAATS